MKTTAYSTKLYYWTQQVHILDLIFLINLTFFLYFMINLAKLHAQLVINQDYPRVAPVFAINIDWKHKRNFLNDEAIRVFLILSFFSVFQITINIQKGYGKRN